MKKSGKYDFLSRKVPLTGPSRTSSLVQIPRPALNLSTFEIRRKLEEDRKVALKSRGVVRNSSVGSLGQPSQVLRPVYVKPESVPQSHRLSLDGSLGAAVYFQEQQAVQHVGVAARAPVNGLARVYNSPVISSSRNPGPATCSQLPSPDSRRQVASSESLPPINNSPAVKRKEVSRPQQRFADSEISSAQPLLKRIITKMSFRTRTGSINGVPKSHNQDAYLIVPDFAGCKNQCLLGVYDGHGMN